MEFNREVAVYYDKRVCRNPVDGEIARINRGRVHGLAHVESEIGRWGSNNAAAGVSAYRTRRRGWSWGRRRRRCRSLYLKRADIDSITYHAIKPNTSLVEERRRRKLWIASING